MAATGVFGGTFDPVHVGHLRTALELFEDLQLAEVRFVPANIPPHRQAPRAPAGLRLRMLRAALEGQHGFEVDSRELERPGLSYTVDTLASMRQEDPHRPLALILGMDAFAGLPDWHRWEQLFEFAHLVVAHRPGAVLPGEGVLGEWLAERGMRDPAGLKSGSGGILEWTVTALDVSASAIRDRVAHGGDPRFLVTDPVRDIIFDSGCYDSARPMDGQAPGGQA